jgi:hypothetical protein
LPGDEQIAKPWDNLFNGAERENAETSLFDIGTKVKKVSKRDGPVAGWTSEQDRGNAPANPL